MKLTLQVVKVSEQGAVDHFDDGSFAAYATVTAKVVQPKGGKQELTILFPQGDPQLGTWPVGSRHEVEIDESLLGPGTELHSGGVKRVGDGR